MTEAQRRLMHARQRVQNSFTSPIQELLDATVQFANDCKARADAAEAELIQLRHELAVANGHPHD